MFVLACILCPRQAALGQNAIYSRVSGYVCVCTCECQIALKTSLIFNKELCKCRSCAFVLLSEEDMACISVTFYVFWHCLSNNILKILSVCCSLLSSSSCVPVLFLSVLLLYHFCPFPDSSFHQTPSNPPTSTLSAITATL